MGITPFLVYTHKVNKVIRSKYKAIRIENSIVIRDTYTSMSSLIAHGGGLMGGGKVGVSHVSGVGEVVPVGLIVLVTH